MVVSLQDDHASRATQNERKIFAQSWNQGATLRFDPEDRRGMLGMQPFWRHDVTVLYIPASIGAEVATTLHNVSEG